MTAKKYVTIWCDFCNEFFATGHHLDKYARRQAKEKHWKFIRGKDICPKCADKFSPEGIIVLPDEKSKYEVMGLRKSGGKTNDRIN